MFQKNFFLFLKLFSFKRKYKNKNFFLLNFFSEKQGVTLNFIPQPMSK